MRVRNISRYFLWSIMLLFMMKTSSAQVLRIANNVIAVQVSTTSGDAKGRFNIGTSAGKTLLYQYPNEPNSSHFNIKIDDVICSNDRRINPDFFLNLAVEPAKKFENTALWCSWSTDEYNVMIEQKLSLEQYSESTGAVFIQYVIINHHTKAHEIGLLLELDTMIGSNDAAPVSTSFGYTNVEKKFEAPNMPTYFQVFEIDPVTTGLIAHGTLVGYKAVPPDLVIIGAFQNLGTVRWDYEPKGEQYKDSAVILRWNPVTVAAGDSCIFSTYYGVGEVEIVSGELALNLSAPAEIQCINGILSPNPLDVNLIVTNTGNQVAADVQARIQLPPELVLYPGELEAKALNPVSLAPKQSGNVSWRVYAQPVKNDITLVIGVTVTSSNAPGNSGQRSIKVYSCQEPIVEFGLKVEPPTWSIAAGQEVSFTIQVQPGQNFNGTVSLSLFPATVEGITPSIVPQVINVLQPATLLFRTSTALSPGFYTFVVTGKSNDVIRHALVAITVQSGAMIDNVPPYVTDHNPAKGAVNVPLNSDVTVHLKDNVAGVDTHSIVMTVNGESVIPVVSGVKLDYEVRYHQPQGWNYNATIQVAVSAQDLATPPNVMPMDVYTFALVQDILPPFVTDFNPVRDARDVPINTAIQVQVRDNLAGVDENSMKMTVNGQTIIPTLSGQPSDFLLTYQPTAPFSFDQEVVITIDARDRSSPSNVMPTVHYRFHTGHALPDLSVANLTMNTQNIFVGQPVHCSVEVSNHHVPIAEPFRLSLSRDGIMIKDSLVSGMGMEQTIVSTAKLHFAAAGFHVIEVIADDGDAVSEISEINNAMRLGVQVKPAGVTVQPNPFTPNQDGYNDKVHFRFAGLELLSPELKIFNVRGELLSTLRRPDGFEFSWDGTDVDGREQKPGVYLYLLQDGENKIASGTVVLAR